MIKQKVIIVNFNSLYEILEEIKENLSFEVIKFETDDDFIKNPDLNTKSSLIITKLYKKLATTSNIKEFFFLNFNDYPLSLNKFLQLINIQLIKLKFSHQSEVNINKYKLDLNSKFFSKNNISLKLTEKEIEIILYLNEAKTKHDVADLQKNIWGYSADMETHTVETHIYRLRKKISNKFNDENFILSHKNGYFIE